MNCLLCIRFISVYSNIGFVILTLDCLFLHQLVHSYIALLFYARMSILTPDCHSNIALFILKLHCYFYIRLWILKGNHMEYSRVKLSLRNQPAEYSHCIRWCVWLQGVWTTWASIRDAGRREQLTNTTQHTKVKTNKQTIINKITKQNNIYITNKSIFF